MSHNTLGFACAVWLTLAACSDDSDTTVGTGPSSGGGGTGASTSVGSGGMGGDTGGAGGVGGVGGMAALVCPEGPFDAPLPAATDATLIQGGFNFLEGPVWFADSQRLLFSDMSFGASGPEGWPPSIVYALGAADDITSFIDPIGSNGLAIDANGDLVACTHDQRSLSRFSLPDATRTTIVDNFEGNAFNSPNDAIVRADGTIYFTDPTWQLGNRPQEIGYKGVYRVDRSGGVSVVADDFGSPNGIALSPDEDVLYVADDSNGQVRRFDVAPDGSTSGDALFATAPGADGMGVDCAGNLYVTSSAGVRVFDAGGSELGTITVGEQPANVTFGGIDRRTLFITARTGLYRIALEVPGLP